MTTGTSAGPGTIATPVRRADQCHTSWHQFRQIVGNTGAPRDRIAARLKALVEAGVLRRYAYQEIPRREEYRLTEAGSDLSRVTQALLDRGDRGRSPIRRCA